MRIFGVPIKIEISFFILAAFLASSRASEPALLIEWLLVAFFSVLIHELGHALAARAFGLSPTIRLYAMGGLTYLNGDASINTGKNLVISLAGPAVGFVTGGIVFGLGAVFPISIRSFVLFSAYHDLIWVNVGWGLFNILPMLPLDGGRVLVAIEEGVLRRRNQVIAHAISLLFALSIFLWALSASRGWIAILGVWFAYSNGQYLFQTLQERRDRPLLAALNEAAAAVNAEESAVCLDLIRDVQKKARTDHVKREAAGLKIFALIKQDRYEEAEKELQIFRALFGRNAYLEGLLFFKRGDSGAARSCLSQAFAEAPFKELGLLLNQVLISEQAFDEVLELTAHPTLVEDKSSLLVYLESKAFDAGNFEMAARAGALAFTEEANPEVAYNVACAFARQGNKIEGIKWLRSAVASGFHDAALLTADADLESLRDLPEFKQLVADIC